MRASASKIGVAMMKSDKHGDQPPPSFLPYLIPYRITLSSQTYILRNLGTKEMVLTTLDFMSPTSYIQAFNLE